ncbi:MAG: hypothetical protein FJ271_02315 [Planctomycetes bacterium]|nr:hypothetical protein [Planctomycetota bacterium]
MPAASALQIPPPANWQDFEQLCCELWKRIWADPETQMHGRRGQAQHGVDVYGRPQPDRQFAGVQCKGKDNFAAKVLTEAEVRGEVTKAQQFTPSLFQFTIATTGPKDTAIELLARNLTTEHEKEGKFSVSVKAWDDILLLLNGHDDLIERYCNVQTSAARIAQVLGPRFDEINERISATLKAQAQPLPSALGIRQKLDDGTTAGREMQFQYDGFLAVARSLRLAYPQVPISELPWPNNILVLEFADGISLRVHVLARFQTAATDVDMMARFIQQTKSGGVLAQELVVFVTGDSSFRHLSDYFQKFPRYGTPVAIATMNSNATIKEWLYLP